MKRIMHITTLLFLPLLMAFPAIAQLSGKVKQGIYTSKEKDFSLKIPQVLEPRSIDYKNMDGLRLVLFTSADCEAYSFTEYGPYSLPEKEWYKARGIQSKLDSLHVAGFHEVPIQTRYGSGYCLYYLLPKGSPCSVIEIKPGDKSGLSSNADAHCLAMFIRIGERMYQFQYYRNVDGGMFFTGWDDGKASEKLSSFVDGFEWKGK